MEISLKTTVYQQVSLICPASYTLFPKQKNSNLRKKVRLYYTSASNPLAVLSLSLTMRPKVLITVHTVLHDMTPHITSLELHQLLYPAVHPAPVTLASELHDRHTPDSGPLHMLSLLPGMVFPQLSIWLAYSLTSGLYSKAA